MAEVWLASRRGAGGVEKRVVIKRILREKISDPRFLELFVQEAEISMSLSHKNIVPIFDFGRVGDELFLVMDYVDGPNLAMALSLANNRGLLPNPILTSHIIFEACQALAYAHDYKDAAGSAQRIAHRDVTPANLLLSFSGEVKLGDFGLAAATAGLSEGDGRMRGTPGYMAPEQARGSMVGPAADIYSLGLVLREVLLGERVRKGEPDEQLRAARQCLPVLPEGLHPALASVCERAGMFEASERYESAQAMAADLDRYLVQARAEASSDRRPMPQQLSDWLATLFPEGLPCVDLKGTQVRGSARTFLDNGLQNLLEDHGDDTMRSMAGTMADAHGQTGSSPPPSESSSRADDGQAQAIGSQAARRKRALVGVIGAATLAASLGALFLLMPGRQASSSNVAPMDVDAAQAVAHDAGAPADGAPSHDPSRDASPPASDASRRDPDSRSREKKRLPAPPPSTTDLAVLRVSSSPWATVRVLGSREGCDETPCLLRLPPGSYQLLFHNPVAGLKKTRSIIVDGDSSIHQVLEPQAR